MRRLWWIPLCFALIVTAVGTYVYGTLVEATRTSVRDEAETILTVNVAAVELWLAHQKTIARAATLEPVVREATEELVELDRRVDDDALHDALLGSEAIARIRESLAPILAENNYVGFGVVRRDGVLLAAGQDRNLGARIPFDFERNERRWSNGETTVSPPARDEASGEAISALRVVAPIRDRDGQTLAMFGFLVPASEFTRVLLLGRSGESGETYVFDRTGLLLTQSRFDDELAKIGLLSPGQASAFSIQVRDPGGDLTQGFEPTAPVLGRPLTKMAAAAITSRASGYDIDGYNDYRGVRVVGVWTWIDELDVGVTTEQDYDEAYAGLGPVRVAFIALALLMLLAAACMLGYSLMIGRFAQRLETARKLGRYHLTEKIGEGGMGKVYRAQHALLRRPTAVKLLDGSSSSDDAVKRFEREVQSTASLTHPNTIAIYDYGHTPDGTFYYAMEYLDGIQLSDLIRLDGPQPEARVAQLLIQAAGSLSEAHEQGIIHRDLKPSNIMLCARGGTFDFVKVLDFGLARGQDDDLHLTKTQSLTGTPLYMSPEALEAPDKVGPQADVYQLGAIGYFLLTGQHVFSGENLVEVLAALLHQEPTPISQVLGHDHTTEFETLILGCLEKDPARRPANAFAFLEALEQCRIEGAWSQKDARSWWEENASQRSSLGGSGSDTRSSLPSDWQADLALRTR